jgi:hypothetical protein
MVSGCLQCSRTVAHKINQMRRLRALISGRAQRKTSRDRQLWGQG